MNISVLQDEGTVTLEVTASGNSKEFICDIIGVEGNSLLVKLLTVNNKILNFSSELLQISACGVSKGKPIKWRKVKVDMTTYQYRKVHRITNLTQGVVVNRRNSFRLTIDEPCYANIGAATVDGYLKDISSEGFCFVVDSSEPLANSNVRISFKDSLLGIKLNLQGNVVRKVQDEENEKTIYGCFMEPSRDIDDYITQRQRRLMRRK